MAHVSGDWRFQNMALISAGHQVRAFLVYGKMVEDITWWYRASLPVQFSFPLLRKSLMLSQEGLTHMTSTNLNNHFKISPPNTINVWIWFCQVSNPWILRGHTHSVHNTWLLHSYKLVRIILIVEYLTCPDFLFL